MRMAGRSHRAGPIGFCRPRRRRRSAGGALSVRSQPDDADFAALGRQRDFALAQAQGVFAEGLAPPALQRLALAVAGGDLVKLGRRGDQRGATPRDSDLAFRSTRRRSARAGLTCICSRRHRVSACPRAASPARLDRGQDAIGDLGLATFAQQKARAAQFLDRGRPGRGQFRAARRPSSPGCAARSAPGHRLRGTGPAP
jgi:hypothetical protein